MTQHNDQVTLRQMLDHAREAVELSQGKSRPDLDSNRHFYLLSLQLLQIVGEAANRVSLPFRDAHPDILWSEIISFRNRLIHGYDRIDLDIMWNVLSKDIPDLVKTLDELIPPAQS